MEESRLLICCPFCPAVSTEASLLSYYFVESEALEYETIRSVTRKYPKVLLDPDIARYPLLSMHRSLFPR